MIPRGLYRNMLVEIFPGYEQVSLETLAHYENKGRASGLVVSEGTHDLTEAKHPDQSLAPKDSIEKELAEAIARDTDYPGRNYKPERIIKKTRKPRARRERRIGIGLPLDAIERNAKVISGLQGQYSRIGLNIETILDQAKSVYHARERNNQNNPEIYELFEDGDIDQALDILGAPLWIIGRPSGGN